MMTTIIHQTCVTPCGTVTLPSTGARGEASQWRIGQVDNAIGVSCDQVRQKLVKIKRAPSPRVLVGEFDKPRHDATPAPAPGFNTGLH
jgi:hypothetical protein